MNNFTNFERMGHKWALIDSWDHHLSFEYRMGIVLKKVQNQARTINNDHFLAYIYICIAFMNNLTHFGRMGLLRALMD